MTKIKKHSTIIIVVILIILTAYTFAKFYFGLYKDFIEPYIQPYFCKQSNIEKIVGYKFPSPITFEEYVVDFDPTYHYDPVDINGIKGLYAKVLLNKDTYAALTSGNNYSGADKYASAIAYYEKQYRDDSFNIENAKDIKVFERFVTLNIIGYEIPFFENYSLTDGYILYILTEESNEPYSSDSFYYLYILI